jgi:GAF domain-containing protein
MSELREQPSPQNETVENEGQIQVMQPTVPFWQKTARFLFEPNPSITEAGARRQAELLAALTLVLFLGTGIGVFFAGNPFALGLLASVSFIVYLISRTKWFLVGAFLLTTVFTLSPAQSIMSGTSPDIGISFYTTLPITMILAFALLPSWGLSIIAALNFLAIIGAPIYAPNADLEGLTRTAGTLGAFIFLVVIANRTRSVTERDRLSEVNEINRELEALSGNLEQRVNERTTELESANKQVEHRAEQFEAIAQVSRIISSIQDQEELLPRITRMISQYFGFYHVGIFLLDDDNQYAILRAANSEGGKHMLKRKHRLEVGQTGIVGFVTSTGNPRVALDTGADAVYFDNPDLPETHSEMALPLKAGGQVIGALDVQSTEPSAFTQEDVNILSTLADQVSAAIQNARLYKESREALAQSEAVSRQLTSQAWTNIQRFTPLVGYHFDGTKPEPLIQPTNGKQTKDQKDALSVPVQLRGKSIGRLRINPATEGHQWTEDEMAIIRATAERVALAAENARLILESQKNAAKEQVIGEISSKIGAAINLDNILQITLREMGRILPGAEISIQVENE